MDRSLGIVRDREKLAKTLSEFSIWRSVVENVVKMEEGAVEEKINILFQAIPDLGIILSQLSLCKSTKLLNEDAYNELMNACLLKLMQEKHVIDFNPLFFQEAN
ncbi:MAG: hypothetical protein ACW98K_02660 [Candidatus Kariarchaeaceae archaeon]|jgi:hypothetical protein